LVSDDSVTELIYNRKRFIESFMTLEDKDRNVVPFKLNRIQDLELAEQSDWKRDIYVKPAQVGSTTLWAAVFLHDTMTRKGTTSVIVAHEEFITQRLLSKVQALYDNLPENLRVPMHRSSAYEKTFPDINGTFYIGSARSYVFGRGEPIHNFLGSEVAFWPDAPKILVPTMQRVPLHGTMVLESTPNGEEGPGQFFFQTFKAGMSGRGRFKAHFYPWWFQDEYSLPEGSLYCLDEDRWGLSNLTDEEGDLIRLHDLTDDQIRWRRLKVREFEQMLETGETRMLFGQEFPEDPDRCFIAAGDAAYDSLQVEVLVRKCYTPDKSYKGSLIWYEPEEGHDYTISVDPGLGKESKTVIQVWEFGEDDGKEYFKHCATQAGYFTGEVTATKILDLADYYKKGNFYPLVSVETNPPGLNVAHVLQNYPRLYYRTDIVSGRRSKVIGWLTTPRTKPHMVSEMQRVLGRITTHDINLVSQFRNMRYVGERVMSMGPDDYHDAAAIAIVCRPAKRTTSGFAGVAGWDNDKW
jgi:hypothetical protein